MAQEKRHLPQICGAAFSCLAEVGIYKRKILRIKKKVKFKKKERKQRPRKHSRKKEENTLTTNKKVRNQDLDQVIDQKTNKFCDLTFCIINSRLSTQNVKVVNWPRLAGSPRDKSLNI